MRPHTLLSRAQAQLPQAVPASQARAARAHARVSTAGRDWLRLSVATDPTLLSGWQYDKRLGVMVERPDDQAADVAHVPADVQAAVGQPAPAPAPAPAP